MPNPRALILRAPGTNCDEETAEAWSAAGAEVETWHVGRLLETPDELARFQILTIPGGFSFGDDLGAGRILANQLGQVLKDALQRFHDQKGLILGIGNGFQLLVRAGLLPGGSLQGPVTLARSASGQFESRWVRLGINSGLSPFLREGETLELPIAHGEGRFLTAEAADLEQLDRSGQLVLRYLDDEDRPTETFPANPNGSALGTAGLCDPTGRILGLMPHPERNVLPWHHPRWTRLPERTEGEGLQIFRNAVMACR